MGMGRWGGEGDGEGLGVLVGVVVVLLTPVFSSISQEVGDGKHCFGRRSMALLE